jgi:glycosyltransferase involved in cell wall biosynthesis
MHDSYPKVLILGETFREDTGGGITLINLFNKWPKELIAIVSDQSIYSLFDIPATYFQLGQDEVRKGIFGLSIKRPFKSGHINKGSLFNSPQSARAYSTRHSLFITSLKYCIFSITGQYKVSKQLLEFVKQFNPSIIYIQPNSYAYAKLANELLESYTFQKIYIHFMDDFKFYYNSKSIILKAFYRHHLNILKTIVNVAVHCFGISPKMCTEYSSLFGKDFLCFHNPVNSNKWSNVNSSVKNYDKNILQVVYSGRIGVVNFHAIMEVIEAIEETNKKSSIRFLFDIYSPDHPKEILEKTKYSKFTTFKGFVSQENIQNILSITHIVLLPISFDEEAIKRSYLSMPTKTAECLACSATILVYAPPITALTEYAIDKSFGYVIHKQGIENIVEGLLILGDESIRKSYNYNALKLALLDHDLNKVSNNFENHLLC